MAKTLYIEIGTEELPAGYILPALESMSLRMGRFLDENRIARGEPTACTSRSSNWVAAESNSEWWYLRISWTSCRLPKALRKDRAQASKTLQ